MEERRRYFRIDDRVILNLKPLSTTERKALANQLQQGEIEYPDKQRLFLTLDTEFLDALSKIPVRETEVAKALELLNRKLNLLSQGAALNKERETIFDKPMVQANLSACGIAYHSETSLAVNAEYQVELVLFPSRKYLLFIARVISCEPVEDEPGYRVGLEVSLIRDEDTERLIQHIMRKESELIKSKRDTSS